METTTLSYSDFQSLAPEAKVRVQYSSNRITEFDQVFSREAQDGAVRITPREWDELWNTYHDYEGHTTFTLVQ